MRQNSKTRVAVIGAGKFGARRAAAAAVHPFTSVAVVADVHLDRADELSRMIGCAATSNWKETVTREDVDVVIVSTPTHLLSPITRLAMEAGKHVLVEKPFGRTAEEVLPLVELAGRMHLRLQGGYNQRYHPALEKAHDLFVRGAIGRVLFLRCCYGHGGRDGYEREWRAQAGVSGGEVVLCPSGPR